jgi:hypothetical protein
VLVEDEGLARGLHHVVRGQDEEDVGGEEQQPHAFARTDIREQRKEAFEPAFRLRQGGLRGGRSRGGHESARAVSVATDYPIDHSGDRRRQGIA